MIVVCCLCCVMIGACSFVAIWRSLRIARCFDCSCLLVAAWYFRVVFAACCLVLAVACVLRVDCCSLLAVRMLLLIAD